MPDTDTFPPFPQLPVYDVVIAGAGPAGAMAALILARAGRRVMVLEKSRWPRDKVCGDCLNPSCWDVWKRHGLEDEFRALPQHVNQGVCLERDGRQVARLAFGHEARWGARAVRRSVLDAWLMGKAVDAGAELVTEVTVTAADTETGVVTTTGADYRGRIILGADGRNSTVARVAGLLPSRAGRCGRVAWQTTLSAAVVDDFVHMHIFPEGYYGLARVDDTHANLCMVLAKSCARAPQAILSRYVPAVEGTPNLPGAPGSPTGPCTWRSVTPVTRSAAALGRGRVWLAGDAARMVEPFTGEGIYFGLATGEAVGECILQTLNALDACKAGVRKGSDASDAVVVPALSSSETAVMRKGLAGYRARHRALYGIRIRVNDFVHWCARSPAVGMRAVGFLAAMPGALSSLVRWVHPPERQALTKP